MAGSISSQLSLVIGKQNQLARQNLNHMQAARPAIKTLLKKKQLDLENNPTRKFSKINVELMSFSRAHDLLMQDMG